MMRQFSQALKNDKEKKLVVMFSVWQGFLWALAQELRVAHCY
jgi:hypothetical protein